MSSFDFILDAVSADHDVNANLNLLALDGNMTSVGAPPKPLGVAFGMWILAERVGLSGVLTMVCYAIVLAQNSPARTPARIRIPAYAVWETVVFVMNVLAFIFIGLQLRPILTSLGAADRGRYLAVAAAVLFTVIVVRVAWHMSFNAVVRWWLRRRGFIRHDPCCGLPPAADWSFRGRACAVFSRWPRPWHSLRHFHIVT